MFVRQCFRETPGHRPNQLTLRLRMMLIWSLSDFTDPVQQLTADEVKRPKPHFSIVHL